MPGAPLVSSAEPSVDGAPGYAVPLAMAKHWQAPIVTAPMPMFYGAPDGPVPQSVTTSGKLVRRVLQRTNQQYDKNVNYAYDSYDESQSEPELNMYLTYDGPFGAPPPMNSMTPSTDVGMGRAWEEPNIFEATVYGDVDLDSGMELNEPVNDWDDMRMPIVGTSVSDLGRLRGMRGMRGLGLTKTITPAATPEQVTLPLPEPVKSSTVFAVVGGSMALVAASIAVYAFFNMKKGR